MNISGYGSQLSTQGRKSEEVGSSLTSTAAVATYLLVYVCACVYTKTLKAPFDFKSHSVSLDVPDMK